MMILIGCCCYDDENTEIIIKVQYSGDFYVFIYNRTIEGKGSVYGIESNNSIKIKENELIPLIGELNYIEISAYKIYEPYEGNLTIKLYIGNDLLSESIATDGIREAELNYQF